MKSILAEPAKSELTVRKINILKIERINYYIIKGVESCLIVISDIMKIPGTVMVY